jgi:hypothetical protein
MDKKPRALPPPLCKAILICERVEFDPVTRQLNLWGVLDRFHVSSFPGYTSSFFVFLLLTDSIGEREVWVEVHDLRDGRVLARTRPDRFQFPRRTDSIFWHLACPPLFLSSPGRYDLITFCDGEEIDRLKFAAVADSAE